MELFWRWEPLNGRGGHEVGRQLLRELYAAHGGGEFPEISIRKGGKPEFSDGKWHFSISHSKNHAFCVLCDRPVGIDAEELSRQVDPRLAGGVLSAGEKAQYDAAADKNRAFLTFWVLKEAQAKQTGRGLGFHPRGTDFSLEDSRVREIDGCLVAIVIQEEENAI